MKFSLFSPRATAEEMQSAAVASDSKNMQYPTATGGYRSNLVNNAQPIALSGPPAFDSNV
jgi:hypothetical protein